MISSLVRSGIAATFAVSAIAAASAENFNLMALEPQAPSASAASDSAEPPNGARDATARHGVHLARSGGRTVPVPRGAAGSILPQNGGVRMACFPGELRGVLSQIGQHFGGAVVVTSGHRASGRRGSFHRRCMAADIQIAGVSPGAIARFARTLPSVGGVGTYGHTRSVHVDVGDRDFTWQGKTWQGKTWKGETWNGARGRSAALRGHGCCPICDAAAAQGKAKPRFEAAACPA